MCFSAEASFVGGVLISAVGVATVRKIHKPNQILFGSIPLFFGLQQFAEGLLWSSLPSADHVILQQASTYVFLAMALVIWPSMIPLSVFLMEKDKSRKKWLLTFLIAGVLLSVYYATCLVFYNVSPEIMEFHIYYANDFPKTIGLIAFIIYLLVTITPLFISSIQRTHIMGALMLFSCVVTLIFFTQFLTSVWCFFAALISVVVYWILHDSKKRVALAN